MPKTMYKGFVSLWDDGDNPGAEELCINFRQWTDGLDVLLNIPSLTLRTNLIGAAQLKSDTVDGVTIGRTPSGAHKLLSVGADHIPANTINGSHLQTTVAGDGLQKDGSGNLAVKADGASVSVGANGISVNASEFTTRSLFDTHDHDARYDARYLSVGYLSSIVRTTLDQTIDGNKTFLKNVSVKKTAPSYDLLHDDGTQLARLYATATPEALLRLEIGNGGGFTTIMESQYGSGNVNFPGLKVQASGKTLATEEYVQQRVRSGSAYLHGQTATLSAGGAGYTLVNGATQILSVPSGMRITKISATALNGTSVVTYEANCSVSAADSLVKLYVQTDGTNKPTFSIRDRNNANLFTFAGTSSPGASAEFAITITVSV